MAVSLQNWRQNIAERWPQLSKIERLTIYFAGLDLFLLAVWQIAALFQRGSSLGGWFRFLAFVTIFFALLTLAGVVRRKLMWRLRNRLIVTYVFIGVIPVVLLLLIGLISTYLFGWQFATYIATSDIQNELSTISTLNHHAATQLADRIDRGAKFTPELLAPYALPARNGAIAEVTAWYAGKPVAIASQPLAALPPGGAPEARGVVIDGDRLLLRVAETVPAGNQKLTVISSVPLDQKMLARIGARLGEVTLWPPQDQRNAKKPAPEPQGGITISTGKSNTRELKVGDETLDLNAPEAASHTIRAGTLPPPARTLDRMITGGTIIDVLDWRTGKTRGALLGVLTRPSLLYARLFTTVGQSTSLILVVLTAVAVVFAIIELFALFIGLRLTRTMTRSIAELYVATEHVNQGKLTHRINVQREDQLGALEHSFNSMTASLERLIEEQKEKQRLENELVIAQEVQAQLFPSHSTDVPGLELYGICRPARTVSGDYYDFLPMDNRKVALAAGDVSGKGISAALLMATIHSAVRAYSLQAEVVPAMAAGSGEGGGAYAGSSLAFANGDLSPARLMSLLNNQLYRSTPLEKYATLFFSTYSAADRTLTYCNAGHLPPIILGADGSTRRLTVGGTVVGLFSEMPYEEGEQRLSPGDIFITYSDGFSEPENDFGEFGEQRLIDLIRENRELPLERISEIAIAAVLDWIGGAEQPDDMTLVLARPN